MKNYTSPPTDISGLGGLDIYEAILGEDGGFGEANQPWATGEQQIRMIFPIS